MPGAESIASHGRTKKVNATTLASLGRLHKAVEELIEVIKTEIIHLVSSIHPVMNLISKIGK